MKSNLTICMPCYNGSKYLNESVGSILSQTLKDFVLLVYDDGSTDDSIDVLKSFNDGRIRIIESKENRGGIYARSQLIKAVDTEYCMWLDSDDRFCRSDAFEYAINKIKSYDFDMVNFIRIDEIDSNGNHKIKEPFLYKDFEYCGDRLFDKFYPTDNHFIFHSKIFKSELLKKSIPGDDILSKRFCADDMFFSAMWFFHAKRYCNDSSSEPILEYKRDIGLWGSRLKDVSPQRIGELCVLQYNAFVSLYNRMIAVRPLTASELNSLINGVNFPMVTRIIAGARKIYGDEYADKLVKVWHSAFGADGVHLLNGIDMFAVPDFIKKLDDMMK